MGHGLVRLTLVRQGPGPVGAVGGWAVVRCDHTELVLQRILLYQKFGAPSLVRPDLRRNEDGV